MTRRAIFAGLVDIACHVVDRHLNPRFVSQAASNDVARLNPKPQTLNPKPLQRPFWVERTPQWGGYGGMLPVGFSERVITRSTGFTVNAVVVGPQT